MCAQTDDLSAETPIESDERFFVLKPYVFGAHKVRFELLGSSASLTCLLSQFDAYHAPWTIPFLPVTLKEHPIGPPPSDPFLADLRPRTLAQTIVHMGRRIEFAPPILTHAAIFSFFFRVEQDPSQATVSPAAAPMGAPPQFRLGPNPLSPNTLAISGKPAKTSLPVLKSTIHDRDFVRLASCVDPYSSRGLPTLASRGELNGSWEGRFSFFDFDSYRDMLGGRMRSLYEGPFGDQPQVWKIEEKIVRLKKGEKQGGKGPTVNAGYEIGQMGPRASASLSPPLGGNAGLPGVGQGLRRKSVDAMGDWGGEGRAAKRPRSLQEDVFEEAPEEDDDGDYEILLTGSVRFPPGSVSGDPTDGFEPTQGHSAWGQFLLKGRVRSYDGMFSITKEYTPDSRGRWLYRGYCIGGNLVGRWRDTHTPIDMSGCELSILFGREMRADVAFFGDCR